MSIALWITGNLIALLVGIAAWQQYGSSAGMFAWAVIAMLVDIRKNTTPAPAREE